MEHLQRPPAFFLTSHKILQRRQDWPSLQPRGQEDLPAHGRTKRWCSEKNPSPSGKPEQPAIAVRRCISLISRVCSYLLAGGVQGGESVF